MTNVIVITAHDLGDYLGCYGTPVSTPNLDVLAAKGILFQNHFSTGSVCSPSRGSIMTGCYPHTNGLMGLVHRGWALHVEQCPHMAQILRDAGYQTHLFGFQHEHYDPHRLGYQTVHTGRGIHIDDVMPLCTEWLHSDQAKAEPFFIGMGFFEVHRLGSSPSHFKRDGYEPVSPEDVIVRPDLPDIPEVRNELADFYGAITFMDKFIGDLLQTLNETGLAEDTILLFVSDHGAPFLHGKATLYDGGTKSACILRWPRGLSVGHRVESLSSHIDILPTLLELLDIPLPSDLQGVSQAQVARKKATSVRTHIFGEKNYTNSYDPSRMVRTESIKYIRKGLQTCLFDFLIPEIEQSPAHFRHPSIFRHYSARRCTEEMYDLVADPGELINLAADPDYEEVLPKMRKALDEYLIATEDPFKKLCNDLFMPETTYDATYESLVKQIELYRKEE